MGADGGIRLMCAEKLIRDKELTEQQFSDFFDVIRDSLTYLQEFPDEKAKSRRVITFYHGDNIFCATNWTDIAERGWDDYNNIELQTLKDELDRLAFDKDEFLSLVRYLWGDCYISEWEVWT